MKPHKHAEFIKAWADGISVEFSNGDFNGWRDVSEKHHWENETEYRIKPAAPKWPETMMTNKEINQAIATDDLQLVSFGETEAGRRVANAALRHSCETGQLVLPDPDRDMKIAKAVQTAVIYAWKQINSTPYDQAVAMHSVNLESIIKEATK